MNMRPVAATRVVYARLWRYVTPHKLIGIIAVFSMAATAVVEAGLAKLLEPLMDDALVARNIETATWLPFAFVDIFVARGIAGFGTEMSLGWIGRSVISDLRRQVFGKFLTLPAKFFDAQAAGPLLSRMTYNVEMVAESVTSVVTIAIRDVLIVMAAFGVMLYWSPKLTLFVAILFPIVGTLGDLVESMFKRAVDVKDSNTMVYGLGGILDMIDSVLFVSPLLYIYIKFGLA